MNLILFFIFLVIYLVYFASLCDKKDKSKLGKQIFKVSIVLMFLQILTMINNHSGYGITLDFGNSIILNIINALDENFLSILAVILIAFVDTENK